MSSALFAPVCAIAPTRRRRFLWAAWWTAAPSRKDNDPVQPGNSNTNPILSPSQLGYTGGLSGMFGGNKTETAPFKGEPTRDSLTQPPPGYQTPSAAQPYGFGGDKGSGWKLPSILDRPVGVER